MDRGEGDDDPALMAEFRHNALNSRKDTVANAYSHPHADIRMRAENQPASQPGSNLIDFRATDHVPFTVAQEAEYAGSGDDGNPVLRQETSEHIPGEERAFRHHGSISPLHPLSVERQVVFDRTHG